MTTTQQSTQPIMAAVQQSSIFEVKDRHMIRLRKMCDAGSTTGYYELLLWLTPNWKPPMTFEEYLKTKQKVSMKKFKNDLKPSQKDVMKSDPTCKTYDISLLYLLILWGNEFLAHKNDSVWKQKDGSLESLINSVKQERNYLAHCYIEIDAMEFFHRTEKLRKLLKNMITEAGVICQHINRREVDRIVHKLDTLINQIRDDPLDPKDFEDYKKQQLFPAKKLFVQDEGKKALQGRHQLYESVTPVSRLACITLSINEIYTKMVLAGRYGKRLELKDILDCSIQSLFNPIILMEGDAGVGKTTLTKKILTEWTNRTGEIRDLDSYDLLLHVECRDQLKSYKELLDSSMADVSTIFQGEDLKMVTLSLRCLIVIDGLDELNKHSTQLFKEIISLKIHHNITVLVTTRPVAIHKYFQLVNPHQIATKHIQVIGIPKEKREDFVRKYHTEIEKKGLSKQGLDGLLKYLRRTEHRLSYLWRLPYNLTLLTILWTNYADVVCNITTGPELHWEIHQLYLSKLKERLQNFEGTQHLPVSIIKRKIQYFIFSLSYEALIGLKNDEITLTAKAYKRLEKTCQEMEIPVEEMVGAFLKGTTSSSGTIRYSFSHKGEQDFLAGHYFWMRLTSPLLSSHILKISKQVQDVLSQNAIPEHVSQHIIRLTEGELNKKSSQATTSIFDILKEIHGSSAIEMPKFQDMLKSLIGTFYLSDEIEDATKMEALNLLQQTGVRGRDAWINILNSVKCDEYVASFISKQENFLEGSIEINDSTLFAYTSLLKGMKTPLEGENMGTIKIDIKGETSDAKELMKEISKKKFNVPEINLFEDFRNPSGDLTLEDSINQAFDSCQVEKYVGSVTPCLMLPYTLLWLHGSVADDNSYGGLQCFLQADDQQLHYLNVCVRPNLDHRKLHQPLPGGLYSYLYIADIQDINDITNASLIAQKLVPTTGSKMFEYLYLPRCSSSICVKEVIRTFQAVRVRYALVFPSTSKPLKDEEDYDIQQLAKKTLQCSIAWGQLRQCGVSFGENIDKW